MRELKTRPTSIAEILGDKKDTLKLYNGMRRYRIWDRWDEIVGKTVADFARPARWRGKTLVVRVAHPSWVQELCFLKPQIMDRISKALPDAWVSDIHFEVGELPSALKGRGIDRPEKPSNLNAKQQEFVDQSTKEISDPELREAARRAIQKGLSAGTRR